MGFLTFGGRGFRLGLLVSMVVLDGYGIHIRSKNARAFNRDRYPASIVFMEFHVGLLQLVSMAILYGYAIHIRSRMRARSTEMGTRRPLCSWNIIWDY